MLAPGSHLASFEVLSLLGSGGMGEVYLARDARLKREVALKILPESLSLDRVRRLRLESEARILALLNHPGIAAIYGLEEHAGALFLVLEYVPGETLHQRLRRGPLPVKEALHVCAQMADALAFAHAKGIVHRDLKCSNVSVTPAGLVKLLDFGLAKVFADEVEATGSERSTTSHGLTTEGAVAGTIAYMSPEQARGQPVDARTDVWAFGCVLFELLTGRPVFSGETPSDVLAAVLQCEPDWTALPARTSESIHRLLRRCLQRDRERRLHHIADARLEIEEAIARPGAPYSLRRATMTAAVGIAVASLAVAFWRRPLDRVADARPRPRLQIQLPRGLDADDLLSAQTSLALSPDGRRLVFAAGPPGKRQLYARALDQLEPQPIVGTLGGDNPFFSPDGQWVGFSTDGQLKTVHVSGGEPSELCSARSLRGASWGQDGTIVFAPTLWDGLWRIPATGGRPQPLTTLAAGHESAHRWPQILPGGKAALFSVISPSGREEERSIEAVLLATGERRVLLKGANYPRCASTGHLLSTRAGTLQATPFDAERLVTAGPTVPVLENVLVWSRTQGTAYYDVADDGTLVYVPSYPQLVDQELVWRDRRGHDEPFGVPPRPYTEPALSPDGRRLAVVEGPTYDIRIFDLDRDAWTRLTFEGDSSSPSWSPDGRRIAFTSIRNGVRNLFVAPADGSGPAVALTQSPTWLTSVSFAPDGHGLVFTEQHAETMADIWRLAADGTRTPLLATPAEERFPSVSPDGRWLAYTSTESQVEEVYVRPFPGPGRRWPLSKGGGTHPAWSKKGRELFYRAGDRMMAVSFRTTPEFTPGEPRALFTVPADGASIDYAVAPDGRFVMLRSDAKEAPSFQIVVILDWFSELRTKLQARAASNAGR